MTNDPTDIARENAALRARLESCLHTGDMEHARMAALIGASTDLLNQLALLTRDDETYLWRIGGRPLSDAYQALSRATTTIRSDADALLAELDAARAVVNEALTIPRSGRLEEALNGLDRVFAVLDAFGLSKRARTE